MSQLNGNHLNGNHQNEVNGTKRLKDSQVISPLEKPAKKPLVNARNDNFEQSVVLRQSPIWSRTIMLSLVGLACFAVLWACFAKIEQAIPAIGQLKPEGTVKDIQAPISGIVKAVYVKDGQVVKPGDLLLTFDSTATAVQLNSLNQIRTSLIQENDIYRRLMSASSARESELEFLRSQLPTEDIYLLKSRAALVAENELLRTQLRNSTTYAGIGTDEQKRLQIAKTELDSRLAAAQSKVEQVKKQLAQIQIKIQNAKASLVIQKNILEKMKVLAEEGGINQLQYLNQQQKVQDTESEVTQLIQEEQRLNYDIEKQRQELINTGAYSDKNISEKIADNKKKIAEIDSQFMRKILENQQRISDADSKISQSNLMIKYQNVLAPVAGTVFDLQAKNAGFVANATDKLMQIVPNDKFIAEVFITNKDIGFVRKGMKADVRIDSFPFSEFGDIKGIVIEVGSDALPPDQNHKFYRFPARISLDRQFLAVQDRKISLQSGMSISANIKVREERTVISLFTELFTKEVESLKEVR